MLHRVNRPNCKAQMRSIYRLQYKVLAFACKPKSAPPFDDQTIFIRRFGHLWGAWLFERVSLSEKFRTALINLIRHIDGDTSKRQVILQAFLNDTQFHRKLNAPSFNFHRNLDQDTRALLKELMSCFTIICLIQVSLTYPQVRQLSSPGKISERLFGQRMLIWIYARHAMGLDRLQYLE